MSKVEQLMKEILDARYQLQESREQGCLHEYIDDQHTELDQLLTKIIWMIDARKSDAA